MEMLGGLAMQMSQQPVEAASEDDKIMMTKVQSLYNTTLKWEMKKNLK
jgi:hypothetical protein